MNNSQNLWWWSYLLTAIGLVSWYLIGKKSIFGFIVGIAGQVLWMVYGFVSNQMGFKISAALYGIIQIKAMIDWTKK